MLDKLTSWISLAMDAAVRWQFGTIPLDFVERREWLAQDPDEFWRRSRIHDPAPVRRGPEIFRLRHGRVSVIDLDGPSYGPGNHPGAKKLIARAHLIEPPRPDRQTVLILHGFLVPVAWWEEGQCRALTKLGANAIRLDQPFHLRRRARDQRSGVGYLSPDIERTRRAVRQAVEDAAALVQWTRENLGPRVSVLGVSLGGLIACLLAAHFELESVVAVAPFCDPPSTFLERLPTRTQRILGISGDSGGVWGDDKATAKRVLDSAMAPIVPRNFTPRTPGERITLIRPVNDAIVGPDPIAALSAAWGTELWDLNEGHISVMNAPGLMGRIHSRLVQPRTRVGEHVALAG